MNSSYFTGAALRIEGEELNVYLGGAVVGSCSGFCGITSFQLLS